MTGATSTQFPRIDQVSPCHFQSNPCKIHPFLTTGMHILNRGSRSIFQAQGRGMEGLSLVSSPPLSSATGTATISTPHFPLPRNPRVPHPLGLYSKIRGSLEVSPPPSRSSSATESTGASPWLSSATVSTGASPQFTSAAGTKSNPLGYTSATGSRNTLPNTLPLLQSPMTPFFSFHLCLSYSRTHFSGALRRSDISATVHNHIHPLYQSPSGTIFPMPYGSPYTLVCRPLNPLVLCYSFVHNPHPGHLYYNFQ